jgi:hypothetical protein
MIECPICGAENQPEAESCRGCGFGLTFSRYTILDLAPVEAPEAAGDAIVSGLPPATAVAPPETDSEEEPGDRRPGQVSGEEHPAGLDVDQLLLKLRDTGPYFVRLGALRKIGQLEASSPEMVKGLLVARASGPDKQMRDGAARLLQASPHRQVLERHPELLEAAAAEVRAAHPRPQAPLGRLSLPEGVTGTRRGQPECEPGAAVVARERQTQERGPDLGWIFSLVELVLELIFR